jgi:hypothetical protein
MTDEPEVGYRDLDDLIALATALLGDAAPLPDIGCSARPQQGHEQLRSV